MSEHDRQFGGSGNAATAPGSRIRLAPGLKLSSEQLELLDLALPTDRDILVKQEFRSGYSGAVVVLVSVGAGRAPLVVKLAHPHDLQREYEAYEEYVRQVSPQNVAHLQGEPMISDDGQLGLLQYTFAGGESHLPTTSLHTYYESSGAAATSEVLNRIFRVFGRHWWADNRARSYVLNEYYDRLLPVHLETSPVEEASEPDHVIRAGESDVLVVTEIEHGQIIRLENFEVIKARDEGRRLTLRAQPPPNQAAAPIRVRVQCQQPTDYRPGDVVDSITVAVIATRLSLLHDAAKEAFPDYDPEAAELVIPAAEGAGSGESMVLPNPLHRLPEQLYSVVETKMSIIHGDLNMQNILVDEPTGFAWLIDFAETRVGPTLLDLQRLEVQVLTKLLPGDGDIRLADIADMMARLHSDPPQPPPASAELHEPYALLVAIRRLARQYLIDDLDWNEYYYGLATALVGALKYDELDNHTRAIALAAAAAVEDCVGKPLASGRSAPMADRALAPPQPQDRAAPNGDKSPSVHGRDTHSRRPSGVWLGVAFAIVAFGLAAIFGWQFARWSAPVATEPSNTEGELAAVIPQTPVSTPEASVAVTVMGSSDENGGIAAGLTVTRTVAAAETSTEPTQSQATSAPTSSSPEPAATEPGVEEAPTATPSPTGESDVGESDSVLALVPVAGDIRVGDVDNAEYVFVPGGEFIMGADDVRPDEGPAHLVSVEPFWIMLTEVTNSQYARCVDAGACSPPASDNWNEGEMANYPVTNVTWEQANEYAQWASGRLPTEAEWELAARSDDERTYPWGDESPSGSLVNFNFTVGTTQPVGSYPDGAAPFGNLDMAGNVEEWVADRYDAEYYSTSPSQNPRGPEAGPLRTVRGGSYYSNGMDIQTFAREKALPDAHFDSVGFRVAKSVE